MDPSLGLPQIFSLSTALQLGGPLLAILVIWWFDRRDIQKLLKQNQESQLAYQKTIQEILETYRADMQDQRRMYENNVTLVKSFERLSTDLREVIILNTQANQRLADTLKYNRMCPNVKVEGT